jgi:hypothetical protein
LLEALGQSEIELATVDIRVDVVVVLDLTSEHQLSISVWVPPAVQARFFDLHAACAVFQADRDHVEEVHDIVSAVPKSPTTATAATAAATTTTAAHTAHSAQSERTRKPGSAERPGRTWRRQMLADVVGNVVPNVVRDVVPVDVVQVGVETRLGRFTLAFIS